MSSLKITSKISKGGMQHNFRLENVNTVVIIILSLVVIGLIIYLKSNQSSEKPQIIKPTPRNDNDTQIIYLEDPYYYDLYYDTYPRWYGGGGSRGGYYPPHYYGGGGGHHRGGRGGGHHGGRGSGRRH